MTTDLTSASNYSSALKIQSFPDIKKILNKITQGGGSRLKKDELSVLGNFARTDGWIHDGSGSLLSSSAVSKFTRDYYAKKGEQVPWSDILLGSKNKGN